MNYMDLIRAQAAKQPNTIGPVAPQGGPSVAMQPGQTFGPASQPGQTFTQAIGLRPRNQTFTQTLGLSPQSNRGMGGLQWLQNNPAPQYPDLARAMMSRGRRTGRRRV